MYVPITLKTRHTVDNAKIAFSPRANLGKHIIYFSFPFRINQTARRINVVNVTAIIVFNEESGLWKPILYRKIFWNKPNNINNAILIPTERVILSARSILYLIISVIISPGIKVKNENPSICCIKGTFNKTVKSVIARNMTQ